MNVFYKGRLQKQFSKWLKKISIHFDHYNLINNKESIVQIWKQKLLYQVNFKIVRLDLH